MAISDVDVRLKKWGKFFGDGRNGLGFPTSSPETKAIDGRGRQCDDGYVPADVQATEDAVKAMKRKFPELFDVVEEFYTTGHRSDVMALRLNVSRTKLFELLDRSHYVIASNLI